MNEQTRQEIVAKHLSKMGLANQEELDMWTRKAYRINGLQEAVNIINTFVKKTIYVFGDYDVDGTMGTTILFLALKRMGCADVKFRIPKRFSEGFGINFTMIDEITEDPEDVLIISVDNGVAALEPVAYAKSKGYTIIITDHHKPVVDNDTVILPDADVVIDPNAIPDSADFDAYSGAGLAYKLACALLSEENVRLLNPSCEDDYLLAITGFVHKLTPLVAVATVCDQVALREENYTLVKTGLEMLNEGEALPGLLILGEALGVSYWTEDTFGYKIGPCINAPERMKDGQASVGMILMMNRDRAKCEQISQMMLSYNEQRKSAVEYGMQKAMEAISARSDGPGYPIVEYIPRLTDDKLEGLEGYLGNIVGRIAEDLGRPCGLFTEAEDGSLKGSFRSVEGYDIKAHLDKCQQEFIQFGGHTMAAGANVDKDNFEQMRSALQACSEMPTESNVITGTPYDVVIQDSDIKEAIDLDETFAPFGQGNEPLIYKVEGFRVVPDGGEVKRKLKGNGLKLRSVYSTAVGFGLWDLAKDIDRPCTLTIYGRISNNHFRGKKTPQIEILDMEVQQPEVSKESKLKELLANAAKNRK